MKLLEAASKVDTAFAEDTLIYMEFSYEHAHPHQKCV